MQTVENSPGYYRTREEQEREAADTAADEAVRQIHLDLADKYRALAKAAEKRATV